MYWFVASPEVPPTSPMSFPPHWTPALSWDYSYTSSINLHRGRVQDQMVLSCLCESVCGCTCTCFIALLTAFLWPCCTLLFFPPPRLLYLIDSCMSVNPLVGELRVRFLMLVLSDLKSPGSKSILLRFFSISCSCSFALLISKPRNVWNGIM